MASGQRAKIRQKARPFGARIWRAGIGPVARAAERFDFLPQGSQQPGPGALPEQLPEKIRCFSFFALQEGLSEFLVVHGGWLVLVLMPSYWCMGPTRRGLGNCGRAIVGDPWFTVVGFGSDALIRVHGSDAKRSGRLWETARRGLGDCGRSDVKPGCASRSPGVRRFGGRKGRRRRGWDELTAGGAP